MFHCVARKAAISAATVPPFRPETSEIALPGGELAATAVSSSNYANPKFTYKALSEVTDQTFEADLPSPPIFILLSVFRRPGVPTPIAGVNSGRTGRAG